VNAVVTTTREFENNLLDPFSGEEKRKTKVEKWRDFYGNLVLDQTYVWARESRGAALPPESAWLSHIQVQPSFEGDDGASGGGFSESRFLGFAT